MVLSEEEQLHHVIIEEKALIEITTITVEEVLLEDIVTITDVHLLELIEIIVRQVADIEIIIEDLLQEQDHQEEEYNLLQIHHVINLATR